MVEIPSQLRTRATAGVILQVKRMKPTRIGAVLIAVATGDVAAMLAGRPDLSPPDPVQVALIEPAAVLITYSDIGLWWAVAAVWPTVAAGVTFIGKCDQPHAINQLADAAGEPIHEFKLIKGKSETIEMLSA